MKSRVHHFLKKMFLMIFNLIRKTCMLNYVDDCDYHQEDCFKNLVNRLNSNNFSMLHLKIRSIENKYGRGGMTTFT